MFYADTVGLWQVYGGIQGFRSAARDPWEPAPLLERLAGEGKTFDMTGSRLVEPLAGEMQLRAPATV